MASQTNVSKQDKSKPDVFKQRRMSSAKPVTYEDDVQSVSNAILSSLKPKKLRVEYPPDKRRVEYPPDNASKTGGVRFVHRPSRPLNHRKVITPIAANARNGAESPEREESSRITFSVAESSSDDDESQGEELAVDETVRLFQTMPKGLEFYLNNGNPRAFKDGIDTFAMQEQNKRLLAEQETQKKVNASGWEFVKKGNEELIEDMKYFDYFLREKERKKRRCLEHYRNYWMDNYKADNQIYHLNAELTQLESKRDRLKTSVRKLGPLMQFEKDLQHETGYKSLRHVMIRHAALKQPLQSQLKKFFQSQEIVDNLLDLKGELFSMMRRSICSLEAKMNELMEIHDRMTEENNVLSRKIDTWRKESLKSEAQANLMQMSIKLMSNNLLNYRPFTIERMEGASDIYTQMDAIGSLIYDYNMLVPEVKQEIKQEMLAKNQPRKTIFREGRLSLYPKQVILSKNQRLSLYPKQEILSKRFSQRRKSTISKEEKQSISTEQEIKSENQPSIITTEEKLSFPGLEMQSENQPSTTTTTEEKLSFPELEIQSENQTRISITTEGKQSISTEQKILSKNQQRKSTISKVNHKTKQNKRSKYRSMM